MPAWDDLPEDQKPFQRRLMEVFAGFGEGAEAGSERAERGHGQTRGAAR